MHYDYRAEYRHELKLNYYGVVLNNVTRQCPLYRSLPSWNMVNLRLIQMTGRARVMIFSKTNNITCMLSECPGGFSGSRVIWSGRVGNQLGPCILLIRIRFFSSFQGRSRRSEKSFGELLRNIYFRYLRQVNCGTRILFAVTWMCHVSLA